MKRVFGFFSILVVLTATLSMITTGTVKAEALVWNVTSNPSNGEDETPNVAVDSSGIYVVGWDESPGNKEWRIEKRSLTTGALITSFGTGGVMTSNPSNGPDFARDVAVDGSGVYIVGYDMSPGNYEWRIEKRSLTTGALLWQKTSNPSGGGDYADGVAVDSSGVYIVGCDSSPGNNCEWRIEKRSLTTGALITSFGTGGVITNNPSNGEDGAFDVAVDGLGLYIFGEDMSPGNLEWRIEKRSLTTGALISSFGTGGVVKVNPSTGEDLAFGVAVDASGVYIVGYDMSPGNEELRIEKRNLTDGSLIWSETNNPSPGDDDAHGVAVDGSGVYIAGDDSSPGNSEWRIEKRNLTDGSLVWSETSNPSPGDDGAHGVALDASGVYIVGHDSSPGNSMWRIEKRVPSETVASVDALVVKAPAGSVYFIYPDYDSDSSHVKPNGAIAAALSDFTAMGVIYGMTVNAQLECLDTSSSCVEQSIGRPSLAGKAVVLVGGQGVHASVRYYDNQRVSPVYPNIEGATIYLYTKSDVKLTSTAFDSTLFGNGISYHQDMFLVEYFMDGNGNAVFVIYGYGWKGSFAGGRYFKSTIYPNISSYTHAYYVYQWNDLNGNNDGFPDLNEITLVTSGD